MLDSREIAEEMGDWFDKNIDRLAFRLELKRDEDGSESLLWHGLVDGKPQTFDVEPYTGFWKRFGIGFLRLLPRITSYNVCYTKLLRRLITGML